MAELTDFLTGDPAAGSDIVGAALKTVRRDLRMAVARLPERVGEETVFRAVSA